MFLDDMLREQLPRRAAYSPQHVLAPDYSHQGSWHRLTQCLR